MPGLTDDETRFLEDAVIPVRLAAVMPSQWPVIVSLWFVPLEGSLWCATQGTAKIVEYLKSDPRCAFEVAPEEPPYRGVRGRATATLHPVRGEEVLKILLRRYLGGIDSPLARTLLAKSATEVAVEIRPASVTSWDYRARMKNSIK
jgi:hypothetical protein